MVNDVKRACCYAKAKRPAYIDVPEEDRNPGDGELVGKIMLSTYGARDAA